MYELVYGFNIDSDNVNEEERILGRIEIDTKDLRKSEIEGDRKFEEAISKLTPAAKYWADSYIEKLGPWIIRSVGYGCVVDGSIRKSTHGFSVVLRPINEENMFYYDVEDPYAFSDKDDYWQDGYEV